MAAGDSKRVVMAALLANLGIAIAKGVAAVFTGSGAMLAETIHSLADSGNQALLLLGGRRSRRPPDERHPFGYGSERYFWAFIVAVVLFALGSLFSLFEGVHKLLDPHPLRQPAWAYCVLLVGLVLEGVSFRIALVEVRKVRGGRRFWPYFFESKEPALPLVFLEDLGALLGLCLALAGVAASHLLGWTWADGAATLAIGLLLGAIAAVLLVRCHRLLVGESATPQDLAAARAAAAGVDGIAEVVDLKTLQIGPEYLLVCLEVRIAGEDEELKVRAVERAVRAAVPSAKYVSIEPV
ncbi:MAG: cation diffusion facilitator family transporter [Planctomycetota bacterium]|jgi:cation diffusion facilitator family transporter